MCTWQDALRTPAFWVFGIASALYGLVASGIGLFNESILAERGFSPEVYYRALAVTAITGLVGNFVAGAWLRLAVAATRPHRGSRFSWRCARRTAARHDARHVMAQAVAIGLAGGFVMVVFFSFWPRVYGRTDLGRIQGVAQALTVFASAIGPLLLAGCVEWTGSYGAMFYLLAAVIGVTAFSAMMTPLPAASPNSPRDKTPAGSPSDRALPAADDRS